MVKVDWALPRGSSGRPRTTAGQIEQEEEDPEANEDEDDLTRNAARQVQNATNDDSKRNPPRGLQTPVGSLAREEGAADPTAPADER